VDCQKFDWLWELHKQTSELVSLLRLDALTWTDIQLSQFTKYQRLAIRPLVLGPGYWRGGLAQDSARHCTYSISQPQSSDMVRRDSDISTMLSRTSRYLWRSVYYLYVFSSLRTNTCELWSGANMGDASMSLVAGPGFSANSIFLQKQKRYVGVSSGKSS